MKVKKLTSFIIAAAMLVSPAVSMGAYADEALSSVLDKVSLEQCSALCRAAGISEEDIWYFDTSDVRVTANITKANVTELLSNDKIHLLNVCTPEYFEGQQYAVIPESIHKYETPDPAQIDPSVPHEHVPVTYSEIYNSYYLHDVKYEEYRIEIYCKLCGETLSLEHIVETSDAPYYEKDAFKEGWNSLDPWEKKFGAPDTDGIPRYLKQLRETDDNAVFTFDVSLNDDYAEYERTHPDSNVELPKELNATYDEELMNWTREDDENLLKQLGLSKPVDNINRFESRKRDIIESRIQAKQADSIRLRWLLNYRNFCTQETGEIVNALGLTDDQIVKLYSDSPLMTLKLTKPEAIRAAKIDLVTRVEIVGDDDINSARKNERRIETLDYADYYDLAADNGVYKPVPEEGHNLTYWHDGYDFFENDNQTAGMNACENGFLYVKIPIWAGDNVIVHVRHHAFCNNKTTEVVELPNTITEIHDGAFSGMKAVKRIYVPASVKSIYDTAFDDVPDDFKMICAKGSYAEQFAKEHNIPYAYPEDDDFDKQAIENKPVSISGLTIFLDGDLYERTSNPDNMRTYKYTGYAVRPDVVIMDGVKTLKPGVDYTLKYFRNMEEGIAKMVIVGAGDYKGRESVEYIISSKVSDIIPGDIDGDGQITSSDALAILRMSADMQTITDNDKKLGDVDYDGELTSNDAVTVLRKSVGLVESIWYSRD